MTHFLSINSYPQKNDQYISTLKQINNFLIIYSYSVLRKAYFKMVCTSESIRSIQAFHIFLTLALIQSHVIIQHQQQCQSQFLPFGSFSGKTEGNSSETFLQKRGKMISIRHYFSKAICNVFAHTYMYHYGKCLQFKSKYMIIKKIKRDVIVFS